MSGCEEMVWNLEKDKMMNNFVFASFGSLPISK